MDERYRWQTVLETLYNFRAYFLVGDKRKRDEMIKNIEDNFDGLVIHLKSDEDMLKQINEVFYANLDKKEKERLEGIFSEVPHHIAIDAYLERSDEEIMFIVDNVLVNDFMIRFASEYQMWLRHDACVYAVMAGSVRNVKKLMNTDPVTFLWRAYRVYTDKEAEQKMSFRKSIK